jgi:hypothetical protein
MVFSCPGGQGLAGESLPGIVADGGPAISRLQGDGVCLVRFKHPPPLYVLYSPISNPPLIPHFSYNEARMRQEFLNPFFEALGWDVFNQLGYPEAFSNR